jgi:hypothetical protein
MDIRVSNFKKGPFGKALAVFDVVLDNALVIKGQTLKQKNDQTGYFLSSFFDKPRKDKEGNPVMKNGKPVWDSPLDLYGAEDASGDYKIVAEAWTAREEILRQATELLGNAAPSAPRTKGKAGAVAASAVVDAKFTDDESDLPF